MPYTDFECTRFTVRDMKHSREDLLIRKKKLKSYPLHWHDCFEIELILEGRIRQTLNGEVYELGKGDIYLLNPTDFHEIEVLEPTVAYNLMFTENIISDEFVKSILSIGGNIILSLSPEEFESTSFLLSQTVKEFEGGRKYSNTYIHSLLECIFIMIMRKYDGEITSTEGENESNVQKALLFMHGHFRENPSMEQAAKVANLNASYFSNLFHQRTGKTYKQYLSELKLSYSKKLLRSSKLSVTEICFACGFNSLSNYLREFKRTYGKTPGDYRKDKQKERETKKSL